MTMFIEPFSEFVWKTKYRYENRNNIFDRSIEDTWFRIAKYIACLELKSERTKWTHRFNNLLADFKFLPGGRIIAGAGTSRQVTLFNCFVMGTIEDSIEGIFNNLKEAALTLQAGGGIGYDFSTLRPDGSYSGHSGGIASGPVSFMDIWDSMCMTIQATGARRGAMMGVLRCDHPDIEKFITVKTDPSRLRHFNLSVLITDAFMKAVEENSNWPLIFPIKNNQSNSREEQIIYRYWPGLGENTACRVVRYISARELWQKLIKAAYDCAEPGVLFEDTVNRFNNLWYREHISATNPCGEIPLPPYGACNLGSLNLVQFVQSPFTNKAKIDWQALENSTEIAIRFLDNVVSLSLYPLQSQKKEALTTRRIGLGITGLADIFVMLGIHYGSKASISLTQQIMQTISYTSWRSSIELAKQRDIFPAYRKRFYLAGEFVQSLPQDIRRDIARYGVRNSHHNAIAPVGSISLLANNVSSGIEPIFAPSFERITKNRTGVTKRFTLLDYAYRIWQDTNSVKELPPAWSDAQSLSPEDHLCIQASVQPYVDSAVSKTIFIPVSMPFETIEQVYTKAYTLGLKGCTIFRPNSITGSILKQSKC